MSRLEGRIIKALSGFYYVLVGEEIITCRARGNFRNNSISPTVGDFVAIKLEEDSIGYVLEVFPRENELLRPKVANVDYNIIVTSVKDPDFSSKLLDKLLVLSEYSHIDSIIVFTKLDLLTVEEKEYFKQVIDYYSSIGYTVFTNSDEDVTLLKDMLTNKFVSISGQSGSGKSTYINKISDNKFEIETNYISKALGRGKHTTRHIEFYKIDNFYIADTPGFSSLDLSFIEKEDLKYQFRDFDNFSCKFPTCNHINEPKCGVKEAIVDNKNIEVRYNNYKELFLEKENEKRRY